MYKNIPKPGKQEILHRVGLPSHSRRKRRLLLFSVQVSLIHFTLLYNVRYLLPVLVINAPAVNHLLVLSMIYRLYSMVVERSPDFVIGIVTYFGLLNGFCAPK
jgi:hypothetical protein